MLNLINCYTKKAFNQHKALDIGSKSRKTGKTVIYENPVSKQKSILYYSSPVTVILPTNNTNILSTNNTNMVVYIVIIAIVLIIIIIAIFIIIFIYKNKNHDIKEEVLNFDF